MKGMGRAVSGEEYMYACMYYEYVSILNIFICQAAQVILPNVAAERGGGRLMWKLVACVCCAILPEHIPVKVMQAFMTNIVNVS